MGTRFHRFSKWFVPQKSRVHIAVFILSLFMIPGALTALQPIDMESYEMESPELTAQTIINQEFSNSEIILGFVISARDPEYVPSVEDWSPVPPMSDGAPIIPHCQMLVRWSRAVNHGKGFLLPRVA